MVDDEDVYDNETDLESVDNSEKSYFHDLQSYWIQECAYINMDASISLPSDPKNIAKALAGPHKEEWLKAIQKEIQVFRDRKIFRKAPQHGRAMKFKMRMTSLLSLKIGWWHADTHRYMD